MCRTAGRPRIAADSAHHAAAHLTYGPAPASLPSGAKVAVVSGDPAQSGPFTIRLLMPAGYRVPPHSHSTDEAISVVKGRFQYGMGDKWDKSKLRTMKAGSSGEMKAGQNHYAHADRPTEIEIASTRPFDITYANPADDPRHKKAAKPKTR